MFWQNEEFSQGLGRDIHLDGVICVVDAVFGKKVGFPIYFSDCILTQIVLHSKSKKIMRRMV